MSPFRSDSARLQTSFVSALLQPLPVANDAPQILKSPYNATHRRRIAVNSRPYRRRTRNSLQFETVGAHIFDTLPWISALESPSDCSPSEIADLSQIHVQDRTYLDTTTGPGPVRRRKTSLRSKPFSSGNADDVSCRSRQPFPREVIVNANQSPPRTPLSRIFAPAAIRFHNLMPVYSDSDDFPYSHLAPSPPSLSSDPLAYTVS